MWVCYVVYSTVHGVTYARGAASASGWTGGGDGRRSPAGSRARHTEALKGQPTVGDLSRAGWVGRMGHHGVSTL